MQYEGKFQSLFLKIIFMKKEITQIFTYTWIPSVYLTSFATYWKMETFDTLLDLTFLNIQEWWNNKNINNFLIFLIPESDLHSLFLQTLVLFSWTQRAWWGCCICYQSLESDCGMRTTPTPPPSRRKFMVPQSFQLLTSESNCSMVLR